MGKRCLIIEDEPVMQHLISAMVSHCGFEPQIASNAQQALQLAREGNFELATVDLMLPEISGLDLLQQFKADPQLKDVPIIIVSAAADQAEWDTARRLGASAMLKKPFTLQEMRDAIQKITGG
ncbi:MAG: response regulator [Anaerolineaceae bacterium]|jgi:two-component system chemotaxis response regulator CheY